MNVSGELSTGLAKQLDPLRIEGLHFSYGKAKMFEDFSLQSQSSRIVLKGPSGCGKTTLLRLLFGDLLPDSVGHMSAPAHRALVVQEDALFPWLSGMQNILMMTNMQREFVELHLLFRVVKPFIDRKAYEMSYGQRRSVELFRVLLEAKGGIYLDEPFNYLDDTKAEAFVDYLSGPAMKDVLLVVTTHRHDTTLDGAASVFGFAGTAPFRTLEVLR